MTLQTKAGGTFAPLGFGLPRALSRSLAATLTTRTNSTSELAFYSLSIPATTLAANDTIQGLVAGDFFANAAGTWVIRMKLDGTTVVQSVTATPTANVTGRKFKLYWSLTAQTTAAQTMEWSSDATATTATTWAVPIGAAFPAGNGWGSSTVNTDAGTKVLEFTVQWSAASTAISITPGHHSTVLHKAAA